MFPSSNPLQGGTGISLNPRPVQTPTKTQLQPAVNPMAYNNIAPAPVHSQTVAPSGGGGGGGTVAHAAAPAAPSYISGVNDPGTLAAYDQSIGQLNNEIGNLPAQLNVGNQNIDTAYNSAFNQLQQAKATNQQTYNTNKTQTAQDYSVGKNTIGVNAGHSLNGLLRLLGAHGAGGSSAATIVAPEDVGQVAANERQTAGQTFGRNNQSLDTNWNNYLTGYNNSATDLGNQRLNNQNGLQAQIAQNRASLLNSLATLTAQKAAATGGSPTAAAQPFLNQANAQLSAATQLGRQVPVFQTAPVTYTAPKLDTYTTAPNPTAAATNPTNAAAESVSPYLSLLLGQDKKQNNLSAA